MKSARIKRMAESCQLEAKYMISRDVNKLFYFVSFYIYIYRYKELLVLRICRNSILPPQREKRYIEYVLFLEDFRRSILEDPIPKNSAPPKTLGSHHGSPWFFPLQSRTQFNVFSFFLQSKHISQAFMSVPAVLPRQSRKKVSLNLQNSYVFQSKFRFFDIDREKP